MLTFLTISSLLIVLEGKRYPANFRDTSHSPFINCGKTCADGGRLKTEFFKAAASRLDSFAARLSAFALVGKTRGERRTNGAVDNAFLLEIDNEGC